MSGRGSAYINIRDSNSMEVAGFDIVEIHTAPGSTLLCYHARRDGTGDRLGDKLGPIDRSPLETVRKHL